MRNVIAPLPRERFLELARLAKRERRDIRDQAALLIESALASTPDPNLSKTPCSARHSPNPPAPSAEQGVPA